MTLVGWRDLLSWGNFILMSWVLDLRIWPLLSGSFNYCALMLTRRVFWNKIAHASNLIIILITCGIFFKYWRFHFLLFGRRSYLTIPGCLTTRPSRCKVQRRRLSRWNYGCNAHVNSVFSLPQLSFQLWLCSTTVERASITPLSWCEPHFC